MGSPLPCIKCLLPPPFQHPHSYIMFLEPNTTTASQDNNTHIYSLPTTISNLSIHPSQSFSESKPMSPLCRSKKKMGITSFFKSKHQQPCTSSPPHPSAWPSCKNPKTGSFRATDDDAYMIVNSVYYDSSLPCFTASSDEDLDSFSSCDDDGSWEVELLRSDRLLFETSRCGTRSILGEEVKWGETKSEGSHFDGGVVMVVESRDPYKDFRASMEEMVAAMKTMEWENLEKLLEWYLRVNGDEMHQMIREAFVDVVLEMVSSAVSSYSSTSSSPSSSAAASSSGFI